MDAHATSTAEAHYGGHLTHCFGNAKPFTISTEQNFKI